ncbi:MAG: Holliday junction branch migration protein RuvA [Bacteroidia bacterium]|nr:Holliday junction branch migration protein RuvA [Bacteroidia bacterium]MDW8014538.1 Holliday junction branch migration protein RuvA [Bacteroidia bacterium]
MLYAVRGRIVSSAPHQVLMEVGGFTLTLRVPLSVSQGLTSQAECQLYTFLLLPKEEGEPLLYGFSTENERRLFMSLLRVNHLGPQKALALLSHYPADRLIQLIQTGNANALSQVKGIGKKLAQQIILDMQPILKDLPSSVFPPHYEDAYEALIALGFTSKEAHERLQLALQREAEASAERLVQLALQSS